MSAGEEEKLAKKEARLLAQREQADRLAGRQAVLDAHYKQSYRRYRDWQATEESLRSLVPKALAVLERALSDEAEPKQALSAALALLRAVGLQSLQPPDRPARYRTDNELDSELEEAPA